MRNLRNFTVATVRIVMTAACIIGMGVLLGVLLILWFAPAKADAATQPVPRPGHPVVNIVDGDHEVAHLRAVYVEMIVAPGTRSKSDPGYSYVQYNTGASQFVRNCNKPNMYKCVDPTSGTVALEDGSFVYLARWAKR